MSKKPKAAKNVRMPRRSKPTKPMSPASRARYDRLSESMKGNTRNLQHGLYSAAVQSGALTALAVQHVEHSEALERLVADRGGMDNVSVIELSLLKKIVVLDRISDHLAGHVLRDGVLSTKGRTRAAVVTYLSVVDRVARLASTLGLERKAKKVGDLESFLQARAVAPAPTQAEEDGDA
jgi:hypothetical protein